MVILEKLNGVSKMAVKSYAKNSQLVLSPDEEMFVVYSSQVAKILRLAGTVNEKEMRK